MIIPDNIRRQVRNRPSIIAYIVLVLTTTVVFANSLRNGFVWDDIVYTVNNPVYKGFDLTGIFTTLANGIEYLPVRDLSYAIDFALGGGPTVFHASNLLIYTLTVLCVFAYARVAYRLIHPCKTENLERRSLVAGFFTALLFAVHPIHSEVVNFITCRNALLSTLFFFAAAISFLRFLTTGPIKKEGMTTFAIALAFFLLSVFAKANSIILPLILLLHVQYLPKERRRKAACSTLPFIAVSVASFFVLTAVAARSNMITDSIGDRTINGSITKLVKALQIMVFYLGKLVYPFDFSVAYDTTKFAWSPATPSVIGIFACLAIALVAFIRFREKAPYLLFGLCWYLAALVPVLNFFSTNPVVADRYAFLPSFAFFFTVASVGADLSTRVKPALFLFVAIVMTAFWGTVAMSRNRVWFSEETLWQETIRISPKSPEGFRNLGNVYLKREEYDKAIEIYSVIADLDPLYYHTIGFVALNRGDLQGAMENFKKALGRNPQFLGSLYYLGITYEKSGEPTMAAELYRQTLLSPDPDINGMKKKARERLATQ